jgi:hypothetical protein
MKRKQLDRGTKRSVTLTFPMPLNLANSRLHWRTKHRHKVAYWAACDALVKPDAWLLNTPIARAVARAELVCWSTSDQDNAMSRMKWIMDWLVTRGYLAGDDPKRLTWAGLPSQRIDRKVPAHIVLTLEEV